MRYLLLILILLTPVICKSQAEKLRSQYLTLNLTQIKESLNFGFVFTGPQIQYGRDWQWKKSNKIYEIENQLGFSPVSNKGTGFDFHLTPFNFHLLLKLNNLFWIGPNILTDYNYEFYPELQTGYNYWFSHYSSGVSFLFVKEFKKNKLNVRLSNSLFGLTSRTPEDYNLFFFDFGLKYAVRNIHRDMTWNFINQYNVSHLELSLRPLQTRRITFSYLVDYISYYKQPDWKRLNYGIKITVASKK